MQSNIISQMYFGRLYPTEEYNKIDLCSLTFYREAIDFYRKKANESEREMLIKGIKLLAFRIKKIEEINEATRTWENNALSMAFFIASEERRRKQNLDLGKPNIARIFDNEVSNILENRKAALEERKRKDAERKEKEIKSLREKSEYDKIVIDSLIDYKDKNLPARLFVKMDFSNILLKIKYDKDSTTKKKVESILQQLNERKFFKNPKGKEITAVAYILFKTGWVVNTNTFVEWLKLFSTLCDDNKIPSYKPNQVEAFIEDVIRKFPFLDNLPAK